MNEYEECKKVINILFFEFLQRRFKGVLDFSELNEFEEFFQKAQDYENRRVVHLIFYGRNKRVRKKNCKRFKEAEQR